VLWLWLAIATIGAAELLLRLRMGDKIRRLRLVARKTQSTLKSNSISDHWKERALLAYAGRIFSLSIQSFALLLAALSPFGAFIALGYWLGADAWTFLLDYRSIAATILIASVYLMVRRHHA
jgi:hypothetical protein